MTSCVLWDVQKDLTSVDEIESGDADLAVHKEVPSTLGEVLEEILKEMEEQCQDCHCENGNSNDNSDTVNTNHSKPLPTHEEALQCVSQPISISLYSSIKSHLIVAGFQIM